MLMRVALLLASLGLQHATLSAGALSYQVFLGLFQELAGSWMQVLFCYLFIPNVGIVVCNGQTISGLEPNSVWLGAENKIEAAF